MKRLIICSLFLVLVTVSAYTGLQAKALQSQQLMPDLEYLGEGAEYTVPEGYGFIIKQRNPFYFEWQPGPNYVASGGRVRVWQSVGTGGVPPAVYHDNVVFGPVEPGCIVQYVAIDDDVDDRINYFLLDGQVIHEMPQGMVSRGEFTIDKAGMLGYEANDSIGIYLDVCSLQVTVTPIATDSPTATSTVPGTPSPAPLTPTPTGTPESGGGPGVTETPTVSVTPTPTATPEQMACARINFEVAGDVAHTGTYVLQEVGGRVLTTWYALDGWESSPWLSGLVISFPEVHVQVLYYANDGSEPVVMDILNHAPGKSYGWLARGMCHAIEVAWP